MPITPAQCRAARALLGWPQSQLSEAAKVSPATLANFEAGRRQPYERTLSDIEEALKAAGVIFIDDARGEGVVKLHPRSIDTVESEVIQYPEFLEGDGGPGSGG